MCHCGTSSTPCPKIINMLATRQQVVASNSRLFGYFSSDNASADLSKYYSMTCMERVNLFLSKTIYSLVFYYLGKSGLL